MALILTIIGCFGLGFAAGVAFMMAKKFNQVACEFDPVDEQRETERRFDAEWVDVK
jgi:hypothetical protein